jgi:hypothetical protein
MSSNRYAGTCATCQQPVPARRGKLVTVDGSPKVAHHSGTCPSPQAAAERRAFAQWERELSS